MVLLTRSTGLDASQCPGREILPVAALEQRGRAAGRSGPARSTERAPGAPCSSRTGVVQRKRYLRRPRTPGESPQAAALPAYLARY